jgi:prevent-host-death family protein
MKEVTTAEARKHMSELLNRAAYGKERFVVTRHGKELVAIVPLEEVTLLDRLRALLSKKDFEAAFAEMEDAGTQSWDEVRRDLDL